MKEIIEEVYDDYLKELNAQNKEQRYTNKEQFFKISNSGMCIKKNYYERFSFEKSITDARSSRLMRLGTLVHDDIQKALMKKAHLWDSLVVEKEVTFPELNIRGHLDIAIIKDGKLTVIDLKTIGSYKWRGLFGHLKNRDKNPSINYQLQLSMYVYCLSKGMGFDPYKDNNRALFYYKRDDSHMKYVEIDSHYIDLAITYWEEVNDYIDDVNEENIEEILVAGRSQNVPVMQWECNPKYCPFHKHCNSPFSK